MNRVIGDVLIKGACVAASLAPFAQPVAARPPQAYEVHYPGEVGSQEEFVAMNNLLGRLGISGAVQNNTCHEDHTVVSDETLGGIIDAEGYVRPDGEGPETPDHLSKNYGNDIDNPDLIYAGQTVHGNCPKVAADPKSTPDSKKDTVTVSSWDFGTAVGVGTFFLGLAALTALGVSKIKPAER